VENLFEVAVCLISHGYELLRSQLTELRYLSCCCLGTEAEIPVETMEFHSVLTRLSPEKTPDLSLKWPVFMLPYRVSAESSASVPECCLGLFIYLSVQKYNCKVWEGDKQWVEFHLLLPQA